MKNLGFFSCLIKLMVLFSKIQNFSFQVKISLE